MHLDIRVLKPEEYPLLLTATPFDRIGFPFDMSHAIPIVGLDSQNKVKAYWFLFDTVHAEPLWISPEYRKNPGIARALWKKVYSTLEASKVGAAYGIVKAESAGYNIPMALRLGFQKMEGQLLFIPISQGVKDANRMITERLSEGSEVV